MRNWIYIYKRNWIYIYKRIYYNYDLVPKGVQEKRTEVLENKVDGMWVSNTFFEWTHVKSSTSEGRIPEKFDFQCDLWQYVEHYTLQQAHITVMLIMQLTAKNQLILQDVIHMSITKWTVVVLCHRTACYAWSVAIDNVQHTAKI